MTLIAGGGEEGRVLPKHLSGRGRLHGRHARGQQVRLLFHLSDKMLNFRLFLLSIHSAANETAATVEGSKAAANNGGVDKADHANANSAATGGSNALPSAAAPPPAKAAAAAASAPEPEMPPPDYAPPTSAATAPLLPPVSQPSNHATNHSQADVPGALQQQQQEWDSKSINVISVNLVPSSIFVLGFFSG